MAQGKKNVPEFTYVLMVNGFRKPYNIEGKQIHLESTTREVFLADFSKRPEHMTCRWHVHDIKTGYYVGLGDTKVKAIEDANKNFINARKKGLIL